MAEHRLNMYSAYNEYCKCIKIVNQTVKQGKEKKCRLPNFPEGVSEHVIGKILAGATVGKSGDLMIGNLRIEIKCFSSTGPSSFGPTCPWNIIIFVDATKHPKIKIWISYASNSSEEWKSLILSSTKGIVTFEDQCKAGRRPRCSFQKIREHVPFEFLGEEDIINVLTSDKHRKYFIQENMEEKIVRIADFFCGIGGIRLGFEHASYKFQVVYSNEIDPTAIKTYEGNFIGKTDNRDVKEVNPDTMPDFDLFIAGFPCQSFSVAGKQKGFDDARGNLFFEIIRILKAKRPQAFLLENVKNLKAHDKGETYKRIEEELKKSGYFFKDKILNSCEYGNVPQNRERIYIVGFLDKNKSELFNFPEKIDLTVRIKDCLEDKVDTRYFYTDKSVIYPKLVEAVKIDVEENQVYQYRRYYVRENKNKLCPTLTANMGQGGHNVPIIKSQGGIRKLTPRECFNLQGFPRDYILPNISDSQLYKQAGNTVTVPVIRRIAEKMLDCLIFQ